MIEFPEPLSFNGDEDDREGGFIRRRTGVRREPDVSELRRCDTCTAPMHWTDRKGLGPIHLIGVGWFCSDRCADLGSERHHRVMRRRD